MEAKLNICPNAVGGRTLLAKSFGLSQLINCGIYMLSVPETVILQTQKNYLHFFGRMKQIRSKDWFCSAHYPKGD